MLRKLSYFFLLSFLLQACSLEPAETYVEDTGPSWTLVTTTDDYNGYVDLTSVERNGRFVSVWHILDYPSETLDAGQALSYLIEYTYDCQNKKFRTGDYNAYDAPMASGNVLESVTAQSGTDWSDFDARPDGAFAAQAHNMLCK